MLLASLCLAAAVNAVPLRGVVEGFYGRPWGTEGRMELIDFMGDVGMNIFIYGPKDDPYHHLKWREEYPADMVGDFRRLLAEAKKKNVRFMWAIHLGDAFVDEKPEARQAEFAALIKKLESMYAIGFRDFAAFFDDFGSLGGGFHAEVCNRIVTDFLEKKGDCGRLVMCPHSYANLGDDAYTKELFARLSDKVDVMWTGRNVCNGIPAADSATVTRNRNGRAPFVWWNWPVNDFCRGKLLMGRAYGVDAAPFSGFVSNPMENWAASKLALWQIAKMTADPGHYDSERVWREGVAKLYPWAPEAMMKFCEHNSNTASGDRKNEEWLASWTREESVAFAKSPDVEKECAAVAAAAKELAEKMPANDPALWREMRNFVELFGILGERGLAAAKGDAAAYRRLSMREGLVSKRQRSYFESLAPEWDVKNCREGEVADTVLAPAVAKFAAERLGGEPGAVKVSVFGDSYSTFEGWIPKTNAVYYAAGEKRPNPDNDVSKVEECWWHRVIAAVGGKLERNESWSGSTIGYKGYGGYDAAAFSFVKRADRLGDPDLILLCGGTNDAWAQAPQGEYKYADWTDADLFTYRPALAKTLAELARLYPKAETVFILNSELSRAVQESTAEVCRHYGVKLVRLHHIDKQCGHPSVNGMRQFADQVVEALAR